MDFTSLVAPKGTLGSIANWVAYGDELLPLGDILNDAQAFIYQSLRCREMMVNGTQLALVPGAFSFTLPPDFLDPIMMSDQFLVEVKLTDLPTIRRLSALDSNGSPVRGQPRKYCLFGNSFFRFDVAANVAMTFTVDYFGIPSPLSGNDPVNFLTTRYPFLLRAACLAMAADFLKDDTGYQKFTARVEGMIQTIQANDDLAFRGGQIPPVYE